MNPTNILIVIPARANSKGIPRKNVRSLNGRPLVTYVIKTALASTHDPDVVVSSDDDEILTIARKAGAKTVKRDDSLAQDHTTLDPVIYHAFQQAEARYQKRYDLIITIQATSPLLKTTSLDKAITVFLNDPSLDTVISARDDTHLNWRKEGDQFVPNYKERLNRQYLPQTVCETGGFLITRRQIITEYNRIGKKVKLLVFSGEETVDIDNYEDWNLAEYYLRRKKILFVVTGYREVGLGHIYRCLGLANEVLNHDIKFLVDKNSRLGFQKIAANNYPVFIQEHDDILDDIKIFDPYIVINDVLDTHESYVSHLRKMGMKVVNFEDLGEGSRQADLVINAMYPERVGVLPEHYYGHNYVVLKSEFYLTPKKIVDENVRRVLLTFGGTDPNNYTYLVLDAIYDFCLQRGIIIEIIAGMGYKEQPSLEPYKKISFHQDVKNMSDHMLQADIVFTSAGRTTFEVASIGVPAIVLTQNDRENLHFFADEEYGFINMGMRPDKDRIMDVFSELVDAYPKRLHMNKTMLDQDILQGKGRVIKLIKDLIAND